MEKAAHVALPPPPPPPPPPYNVASRGAFEQNDSTLYEEGRMNGEIVIKGQVHHDFWLGLQKEGCK